MFRERHGELQKWRFVRSIAISAYAAGAAFSFWQNGVPVSRDRLVLWLLGALFCLSLGNLRRFGLGLVFDWAPLLAALMLYDVVRGAFGGQFPIWAGPQIRIGRLVTGDGQPPVVWLQQHLWNPDHIRWWDYATWVTYTSFFLVTPVVLAWLWLRDRDRFRSYAFRLTALSFTSFAFFTVVPSMPPWLASEKGFILPVKRFIGQVGAHVPVIDFAPAYERGVSLENDLAAFPSLHMAMTVLLALFFWKTAGRTLRVVLVVYPLAMAFSLVYSAEHYVIDLLAGAALVVVLEYVWRWATDHGPAWTRRFVTENIRPLTSPVSAS